MSKSNIAIIILAISLLVSNGFWAYASMSSKEATRNPSSKYEQSKPVVDPYNDAILPLEAAIAASGSPQASRDSIVRAASEVSRSNKPSICMWDEDVVRVRGIGLKFDQNGKLIGATTSHCAS